jgi:hypothetical protein
MPTGKTPGRFTGKDLPVRLPADNLCRREKKGTSFPLTYGLRRLCAAHEALQVG